MPAFVNPGLCLILRIYISTPFAREEQSLGVGVCWRSISMIFTANIPSDFILLELYYYDFY